MGTTFSNPNTATIIGLSVAIGVSALMLVCIAWQFYRFRRHEKKKAEEERKKKEANSLQTRTVERTGDVPYRLGEDVFPSSYPYPAAFGGGYGEYGGYGGYGGYGTDMPIDIDIPIEVPVECPGSCPGPEMMEYPQQRGSFFPMEECPYAMRPSVQPLPMCDYCEEEPEPPSRRVILEPIEQAPQPLPPPPPQREVIREIYIPIQPPPQPQPPPPPPPPPPQPRRGSWGGPDEWVLVKKQVKKTSAKKRSSRKYEESDSDSSSSSEDEEPKYNRRLMPYDLAMPTRFVQVPQQPIQLPSPAPAPAIYFIQQPAPPPPPAPAPPPPPPPPPAPIMMPYPVPMPIPAPRNAYFAANGRSFNSGQYEEQEQRATVAGDECFDCSF